MLKILLPLTFFLNALVSVAQTKPAAEKPAGVKRPKLVVGIVVDQMRWDFLYRYNDRYDAAGGFKRLLNQGFTCENTFIPYTPTITACGHTCIYTGSVPAIHGIVGNSWWDNHTMRSVYCTEDKTVSTVGSTTVAGEMSPANMLATTITDELRLATNFKSKVIGIAIKDRGGILPAGHSANAAYWYDSKSGQWITSTYYMKELPAWVKTFNAAGMVDKYYEKGWSTLYPLYTYTQSSKDFKSYEGKPFGSDKGGFPYDLKGMIGKNYAAVNTTPFGNTMTLEMAKAALDAEKMGAGGVTDFLAVSLSSPDYVGHAFGPNSIEAEDTYLRLDKDLGSFLDYLDQKVGKGQYLVFLSADHGVAHVPGFMKENKLPGGNINDEAWKTILNRELREKFGQDNIISTILNYQVYLNNKLIDSVKLNKEEISNDVIRYLVRREGVARAFKNDAISTVTLNARMKDMFSNGYYPSRSGDIQIVLQPGWIDGGATGTTHGLWNPYDSHIPLVWYGWNIKPGRTNRETYMTDIAPTIAAMLRIQMPNGCVGKVIEEVVK